MDAERLFNIRKEIVEFESELVNEIFRFFEVNFPDKKEVEIKCGDFCTSTPMITFTQSLDVIRLSARRLINGVEIPAISIEASGEYDNDTYGLSQLSTYTLTDIVEFLTEYRKEIIEQVNEEYEEED